ncbi:MAG: TRAP transporter small permease subunit [Kangiellaceae bacterium]|jgi:TRAP-type mannitol/chloroaromatic compound transport system permease small subunit|nr:TRAP transporter small permease subunit [Kangiellaceae bacterium]
MWKIIKQTLSAITAFSGKAISLLTVLMVIAMFVSALLSNLFKINFIWLQESVTWLHAAVFMIGAAYTLQANEHVRVDIFYQRFSTKTRAIIDLFGTLCFLIPVSVFLLVTSLKYVTLSWRLSEASAEAGGLSGVYLLKSLVLVLPVLLIIEGCHQLMLKIEIIKANGQSADTDQQANQTGAEL